MPDCFKRLIFTCACVLALNACGFVNRASGAFIISSSRYADGANDVIVFRALNDGTGSQAGTTELGSASITLTSVGKAMLFNFQDLDGDGVNDANVLGYNSGFAFPTNSTPTANLPIGSFIRIGDVASNFMVVHNGGIMPAAYSDPDGDHISDGINPTANYTNLQSFHVEGTIFGGGVSANPSPASFAVALVPAGTEIDLSGTLAAEAGPSVSVSAINVSSTPEPGSIGLFATAVGVLCLRRRRRTAGALRC